MMSIYLSGFLSFLLCALSSAMLFGDLKTPLVVKAAGRPSFISDKNIAPLFIAAWKGDCPQVKALLHDGLPVNEVTKKNTSFPLGLINNQKGKTTALMLASFAGSPDMVKLLLQHGAHVNLQDDFGQTALIYAILSDNNWPHRPLSNKHQQIIKLLLEYNADPSLEDALGQNALYYYSFLARLVPGCGEFGYEEDPAAAHNDPLYRALKQR